MVLQINGEQAVELRCFLEVSVSRGGEVIGSRTWDSCHNNSGTHAFYGQALVWEKPPAETQVVELDGTKYKFYESIELPLEVQMNCQGRVGSECAIDGDMMTWHVHFAADEDRLISQACAHVRMKACGCGCMHAYLPACLNVCVVPVCLHAYGPAFLRASVQERANACVCLQLVNTLAATKE